jgi:multidrug efflux pump subunit AcrA (membrane-fusion protein)
MVQMNRLRIANSGLRIGAARVRTAMAASVAWAVLWACSGSGTRAERAPNDNPQSTIPNPQSGMGGMEGMEGMPGMAMGGDGPIRITARQAALAGVTFAVARQAPVERTVRAVATAVPNERGLAIVNARVSGWVEELYANETGRLVRAGEPLLELYAPELVTAQEELLLARRLAATAGGDSLVAAARRRLALWNIADQEIAEIERMGQVRRRLVIRAPAAGHILEKQVLEGQMVQAGAQLFKIADLSTIWIEPRSSRRTSRSCAWGCGPR